MQSLSGKVGMAPGTTTMTLAGQNPGVVVRNAYGERMDGAGLGYIQPDDFAMSMIRDYMPVDEGWIVGVPTPPLPPLGAAGERPAWVMPVVVAGVVGVLGTAAYIFLRR